MHIPGLNYQLYLLEQLVTETIPALCSNAAPEQTAADTLLAALKVEAKRTERALAEAAYRCSKEYSLYLFIEQHQKKLIELADYIYTAPFQEPLRIGCINCITDLLQYLQWHFEGYFNTKLLMPVYNALATAKQTAANSRALQKKFGRSNVNPALLQAVLSVFNDYSKHLHYASYHRNNYLHFAFEELLQAAGEASFTDCLYRINFNLPLCIHYLQQQAEQELTPALSVAEKIKLLYSRRKKLLLLQTVPDKALCYGTPGLRQVILEWLEEEIDFTEREYMHSHTALPGKATPLLRAVKAINIQLSAPEIALLARLLLEKGFFTAADRPALLRQIAAYFTSKGTNGKQLSWESLNSKYSAVEQSTVLSVRNLLFDLNNRLREIERGLK